MSCHFKRSVNSSDEKIHYKCVFVLKKMYFCIEI